MITKQIPYGHQKITAEDIQAVVDVLQSDFLTQGPRIKEFENVFAQYVGAKYAVAVNNATAGLHLASVALCIKPGDKVIVTPLTFAASANCVCYCGGDVIFCDIDKDSYLIDIDKLHKILRYPVNLEKLRQLADEYGLWILEDACHAPGGYFIDSGENEQRCGNGRLADISVFSFHPVKHITTGEGGMITTNNKQLYDKLCLYRTHGISKDPLLMKENHGGWYNEMIGLGFNYRLTDFQAALGISQLRRADSGLIRRRQIAAKYNQAFTGIAGLKIPFVEEKYYHAYHLYVIQVKDRYGLYDFLRKQNILVQVHYVPLHLMPYYQKRGNKKGDLPIVEAYYQHCLSLPIFPSLTEEEQDYIIEKVIYFCSTR